MKAEKIIRTLLLASAALPIVAVASPVVYEFKGSVTAVSGTYFTGVTVGEAIDGFLTVDFANTTSSCGTLGATTAGCGVNQYDYLQSQATGGATGLPLSSAWVFSISATVGNFSFAPSPGPAGSSSSVGGTNGFNGFAGWLGLSTQSTGPGVCLFCAQVALGGGNSAWQPDGLPTTFSTGSATDTGYFILNNNTGTIDYQFTELLPVPEPSAYILMSVGIGVLAFAASRRRGNLT